MAPVMMVPIFARNAARARYSAGRATSACSSPPMPNAAAPIAKGPTSGANVAAVPVVPQSAAAPSTERVPSSVPAGLVGDCVLRGCGVRGCGADKVLVLLVGVGSDDAA